MNWLRRGWRAVGNRLSDPLEDAVKQARRGWNNITARNREAPPSRIFTLHLIRAAISWVTRLGFDHNANRTIKRSVKRLGKLVKRWTERAKLLKKRYEAEREIRNELDAHRRDHATAIRRNLITLGLAVGAAVLLTMVDLPFVEGAVEMLIDDPTKTILGIKIVSLAGWGFVLGIAGMAKLSANALRGIFSDERRRSDIPLLTLCVALVVGSVIAFAGPRQEAVQGGGGGPSSSLTIPGVDPPEAGETDGGDFPWLLVLLGISPYLFATVLLAGAQTRAAEDELKLIGKHAWSRWQMWLGEKRFGRVQIGVDRAERRITNAILNLKRSIGEEEASRIVHAEGYRLTEEWNGWLTETPTLIQVIANTTPGALPAFDPDELARLGISADDVVKGGSVRQLLEQEFGNPLAERAHAVHVQATVESLPAPHEASPEQNGKPPHGSEAPAVEP